MQSSSLPERIEYAAVQAAIERCLRTHPAQGEDHALPRDASLLAEILGELIWRKAQALPLANLSEAQAEALLRWQSIDHGVER